MLFLVEDDEITRKLLRMLFTRHLFGGTEDCILEASTAEGALRMLPEAKSCGVRVAIVDGLEGRGSEVAGILRREIPGIRIVAYSGLSQEWGDANLLKTAPNEELVGAVRAFLEEKKDAAA